MEAEGSSRETTLYNVGYYTTYHTASESAPHLQLGFDSGYSTSFPNAIEIGESLGTLMAASSLTGEGGEEARAVRDRIKRGLVDVTDLANKRENKVNEELDDDDDDGDWLYDEDEGELPPPSPKKNDVENPHPAITMYNEVKAMLNVESR
ncbi:hypothetical protein TrLO_g2376 [Triparma laevis f. longispina]|uniref:Uncharacterized protein n=1 Tax=Triparma laevis f. longispina TaxID=1714387 RepID=A0A9W7AVI6_9STRA|nr:hypothetical protein TrLO_g2376 [Triparma laevis f. longispina]